MLAGAEVDWQGTWGAVADRLRVHLVAGRGSWLREEHLRWETLLVLQESGVGPDRLHAEWPYPGPDRQAADLVVDDPPSAVIEFKFPRDPRTDSSSADTTTLGELLKDLYRLSAVQDVPDRWAVMLLGDRLLRYLSRRREVSWAAVPGDTIHFGPEAHGLLPVTARQIVASQAAESLHAHCASLHDLGNGLTMFVLQVDRDGDTRDLSSTPTTPAAGTSNDFRP